MKKFIAFTLAETLIVMGIIGVVAALTLPNLNSTTGEKEKVAKVKKIYSNLNDAVGRAVAVYGPYEEWFVSDGGNETLIENRGFERITEFIKVSKSNVSNHTAILADGTEVFISVTSCDSSRYYSGKDWCGYINVDIDGKQKGKNLYGYDKFVFDIMGDGSVMPAGQDADNGDAPCKKVGTDLYCARWVVENDNMDYLKCFDKLKWGQVTSCK